MAPWLTIFKDDVHPEDAMYNNFRVFGTGLLCIMGIENEYYRIYRMAHNFKLQFICFQKVLSCSLEWNLLINLQLSHWPVLFSPLLQFMLEYSIIGTATINYSKSSIISLSILSILIANRSKSSLCVLGKRLVKDVDIGNCTKDIGSKLYNTYCNVSTGLCEEYYRSNGIRIKFTVTAI